MSYRPHCGDRHRCASPVAMPRLNLGSDSTSFLNFFGSVVASFTLFLQAGTFPLRASPATGILSGRRLKPYCIRRVALPSNFSLVLGAAAVVWLLSQTRNRAYSN